MKSSITDSYQLSSLIELTSNLADESMHSDLSSKTILLNAVNKLLWTLNFDHCLMIHSNGQTDYLYGDSEDSLISEINKLSIKELKNNTIIKLNQIDFYLTYQILPLENDKANTLVFLQQNQAFSSSSLILIELFSAAVKRLLITKEQEHKRIKLKNEAQVLLRSNQLKSEFLGNMSHELKTPMNGILSLVKLLQSTELEQTQFDMLTTIYDSTHNLLNVVNDVLEYSQLDTNNIKILTTPFVVNDFFKALLQPIEKVIKDKKLCLKCQISPNVPRQLIGDTLRINQLLSNILNNAVKFTEQGEISIYVNGQSDANNLFNLNIEVSDTGPGMSEDAQTWLFEPFVQGDGSTTRQYGGTGLGLAITSKLAKAMCGNIKVESKQEQGTKFIVTLPLKVVSELNPLSSNTHQAPDIKHDLKLQPHSILIVEDNLINQKVAGLLLAKLGYEFDIAENGQVALEKLEKRHYSFIFMDIQMPVMNGYDATKAIIHRYKQQRPTIVAMTANTFDTDKEQCFAVGMDDFVAKPISEQEIIRVLSLYPVRIAPS